MNNATAASPTNLLDVLAQTGDGKVPNTTNERKHVSAFPVENIVFVPEENYRWGSEAGMVADLLNTVCGTSDEAKVASYNTLRESIRTIGVQDPVGLVEREDGYHVVFGFTRVHAAIELKIATIPAYIYPKDIDDSVIELLQVRENSPALKRSVNWVAEAEMYTSLWGALYSRMKERAGKTDEEDASLRKRAKETICAVLGRSPSRLRSMAHFLHVLDPRVLALARAGHLDSHAATEFHSGSVEHPYKPAQITAFLKHLHGRDGYPAVITAPAIRAAKKCVNLQLERGAEQPGDDADVGEEPQERVVARGASSAPQERDQRAASKASARQGVPGPLAAMRGSSDKMRTSPAALRDLSDLVAWGAINDLKLSVRSLSLAGQKLLDTPEWLKVQGIGWGADTVTMPPLMEVILGGRSPDDTEIVRMQQQHEVSQHRYVISAFIRAFLRAAMCDLGVRNLDYDDRGWISGKSPDAKGNTCHHRSVWTTAVQDAVAMPGEVMILDRAKAAWERIRHHVKAKK